MKSLLTSRIGLLVIILLAIILCLAIVIQILKSECVVAKTIFDFVSEWAIVLGAVATLMLAFAAFWSVNRSIEHEKRVRIENQEVEFKRHVISDVIQWLQDVVSGMFLGEKEVSPAVLALKDTAMLLLSSRLTTLARLGDFAMEAAGIFGADFQDNIRNVINDLWSAAENVPGKNEVFPGKLEEPMRQLMSSVNNAIKEAYRLKSEHKL